MSNSVINRIKNKLGADKAKMYEESAPMFNAKIVTSDKHDYFVESSQFTNGDGSKRQREYVLKVIGDNHISKVKEFNGRNDALEFFKNMEFTKTGSLILDRNLETKNRFDEKNSSSHDKREYDNGYTACYSTWYKSTVQTYCEGDTALIHCNGVDVFNAEIKEHVDFYNKNEA